jgi:hypothetical protein
METFPKQEPRANEKKKNRKRKPASRLEAARQRNLSVKVSMAKELSSQGLPQEAIARVLNLDEEEL